MNKLNIFVPACCLMFVLSQLVPFACGADRLTFGLHAEELPSSEAWKEEFSQISSKGVVSMSLSTEDLQALLERCNKLQPIIEGLDETPRKLYLKRLKKTKALFNFVLESHQETPNQ